MTLRHTRPIALAATIAATGIVWSQGRGNPTEWPTAYGDAQHTSWIRNDVSISPETMSQPGFELQWKTTLESPVRHGVSLGAGVVTSGINIFTPLSTIAAPSNQIFAVDNDTGNLFWTRRFDGTLAAGTRGVSRGNLRDVDADGEPHDSGSRSREGRRARKRVLQQRGRRAWRWRADSQPRRRCGPRDTRAEPNSGGASTAPDRGCSAGPSAALDDSAGSNASVTVPDECGGTRIRRRVVSAFGRRLCGER